MLTKVVAIFLLVMVALAFFGKLRFPGGGRMLKGRKTQKTCDRCGRYLIGKAGCDCGKQG